LLVILSIFTLLIKRFIFSLLIVTLLSGCESLKFRNLGKSGVTTGVAYVIGGTIPAIGVLTAAMAYDEIIPDAPDVGEIESKEQAFAYVAEQGFIYGLYAFIVFLLFTNIITPYFAKKNGYNKAKAKYKGNEDD